MNDDEINQLCADAMQLGERPLISCENCVESVWIYDPLHDDRQAMALEDWLCERGALTYCNKTVIFTPYKGDSWTHEYGHSEGRRRCICECVAKMQKSLCQNA